jgi:hypothetical protein
MFTNVRYVLKPAIVLADELKLKLLAIRVYLIQVNSCNLVQEKKKVSDLTIISKRLIKKPRV